MDVSYIGKNFKTDTNVLLYMCTCILHPYNVDQVKYRQYMYIPPMVSYDIHEEKYHFEKKCCYIFKDYNAKHSLWEWSHDKAFQTSDSPIPEFQCVHSTEKVFQWNKR